MSYIYHVLSYKNIIIIKDFELLSKSSKELLSFLNSIRPWPWPDDEGREGEAFLLCSMACAHRPIEQGGKKKSLVLEEDEEHHD